ncbi:MAG: sugar phosphate nucleotidyltransferase [Gemmatimonadota bacterium]
MTSSQTTPSEAEPGTPSLWVVILAGGIGSRFWPVSTPDRPKQLLPLGSERALIRDTVDRALKVVPAGRLRILTGVHLLEPLSQALPELPRECYLLEPMARGTGPVLAWAAHAIAQEDPDAVLISLHADHVIHPEPAFSSLLRAAARVARDEDCLLTVAVPPTRPETGYGYIKPGKAIPAPEGFAAFRVSAFVEKPDAATATRYVEEGYLWNSGLFIWPVRRFLRELKEHSPEMAPALVGLAAGGSVEDFFHHVTGISVDEAVLERSARVASIEATFQWDDVGSWEALSRTRTADAQGNVVVGDGHLVETRDSIAFAETGPVVLFGVQNLVVVRQGPITLVMDRDRAPELKRLLDALPPEVVSGSQTRDGSDPSGVTRTQAASGHHDPDGTQP